jgi:hypothetical protein
MDTLKILTIYDGPAFAFKLGLAITGKKKGWLYIQHEDCKWTSILKLVDFKNIHENVEVQPYSLTIKPFKEVMEDFNNSLKRCNPANRDITPVMRTFGDLVARGIYNRVWKDIKKQLTGGE